MTLRRAQRGDADACRALVDRYQRPVFGLLHRMLGDDRRDRVEDLAQETFLHVLRSLSRFAPLGPARLSTWILTIASRRAVDELRRIGRDDQLRTEPPSGREESPPHADGRAQESATAARVAAVAADLAPEYRAAFLLRAYHGFDDAEIARALDIDVGPVKSRLSRARAELRRALGEGDRPASPASDPREGDRLSSDPREGDQLSSDPREGDRSSSDPRDRGRSSSDQPDRHEDDER